MQKNEFHHLVQDKSTAAGIPVVDFGRQVGCNGLDVELLGLVDIVHMAGKVGWHALLTEFSVAFSVADQWIRLLV